jgi:hypothetical protein
MATEKTCDVCGVTGAATIVVAILCNTPDVGTSQGKDLCALHRAEYMDLLYTQCKFDIEAALTAV